VERSKLDGPVISMGRRYHISYHSYREPRQLISATEVAQGASHDPAPARQQKTRALRSG
jgi:hypothetical protein